MGKFKDLDLRLQEEADRKERTLVIVHQRINGVSVKKIDTRFIKKGGLK